jgi:Tfp pilus assembly protein PilF
VDAVLMLGRIHMQMHKDSQAEAEVRHALELDPKNAPALLSLATIQTSSKRLGEAEQTYKRLSLLPDPDYNPLYGLFLIQQGKQDAAVAEFQRLAKANPNDRKARALLLGVYVLTNKLPQAEAVLAEALKVNPKDVDALILRAKFRLQAHDAAGAEQDLQEVLKFQSNSAAAHFEFAQLKAMQGLARTARQELSQSLTLDRNYLEARLALAWDFVSTNEAKSALELLDQTPPAQMNNPGVLIQRNWALLGLGKFKEARQGIDQGLKRARAPELVEQDGFLKMQESDSAGARADAEELLKRYPDRDPDNVRAVRLLVNSCVAQHQGPQAVQELREVVSQRPKSAQLQTLLGGVLVAFGDRKGGRTAFEAAVAANPKYLQAKLELAQLDVQENRLDSARRTLESVVASDPKNVSALLTLADAEATAGVRSAAIARYRSVLAVDESNFQALKNMAGIIVDDNPDEALRFAERAVEIAPEDASAQDTLGWVYYRKGVYGPAAEHLKVAVAKEPTPRRQYHLAMSYLKNGDRDRGQPLLASALKQDPKLATEKQE